MNLKIELLGITAKLREAEIPYALCGGLAVAVHGCPRLTKDIDLLIRPDDLEAIRKELEDIGYSIPGGVVPFDIGKPNERRVFRVSKRVGDDILTVDLLLLPEFLLEVWRSREVFEIEETPVSVVSREGLLRMKQVAGRPRDKADTEALLALRQKEDDGR